MIAQHIDTGLRKEICGRRIMPENINITVYPGKRRAKNGNKKTICGNTPANPPVVRVYTGGVRVE